VEEFVKIFRALGDPTRQRIVKLLASQDMYVCQLAYVLEVGQSNISQHLRVLREARLVSEEKLGWWTLYRLNRPYLDEVLQKWSTFLDAPIPKTEGWLAIAERVLEWEKTDTASACPPRKPARA